MYTILGGERIEVYFEMATSACIVEKMCQVHLFHRTNLPYVGVFSVEKVSGYKTGSDLVVMNRGIANEDMEDSQRLRLEDDGRLDYQTKHYHFFYKRSQEPMDTRLE